ncbi:MAG: hypothetical protein IH853_09010 [Bacteroidetes bacterium]|nr:hypothetical protein [Bacteroidota bacterium]
MKNRILSFILVSLIALPTVAQDAADLPEADPADVESVDALIAAVYDVISGPAGEKRDWDRFRSLFRTEAKLINTGVAPSGEVRLRYSGVEEYIAQSGAFLEERGFFERELYRVQEEFGNIVHLFSTYDSRWKKDDPEPFARGINSFQLVHDGSRWWVVNIFWQGESPNASIPEKYLPQG